MVLVGSRPRVAQISTLPDPLPCPWPPMGPFSPVGLQDLQMIQVPLDLILALQKVSDGVKVLKWRAFEPQTKLFGSKPLSTTANIDAGAPALTQDAKQEQRTEEGNQENEEDVLGTVDITTDATMSAPPKKSKGRRKRSIKEVDGAEELLKGSTKALKRTYTRCGGARLIARPVVISSKRTRTGGTTPPCAAQAKTHLVRSLRCPGLALRAIRLAWSDGSASLLGIDAAFEEEVIEGGAGAHLVQPEVCRVWTQGIAPFASVERRSGRWKVGADMMNVAVQYQRETYVQSAMGDAVRLYQRLWMKAIRGNTKDAATYPRNVPRDESFEFGAARLCVYARFGTRLSIGVAVLAVVKYQPNRAALEKRTNESGFEKA
ncbi:hypothetical protein PLEOSDRAFT_171897 [Pleurotus ostreatus PC15]|uniref:Uncharacterized protein n=1 Tax=Pleurotus ostreatus (strain PC15) TaxID=1137138 RepID=A0A067N3W0_PLEO1|nr:hypothetical protein PLEOSDRAFT_171897 [Pleurotus ostreatus PC15]